MKAVILVGGKGERLMPLTKNTRKAYLPLGGKRVVDHIIDRLPKRMKYSVSENDSGVMVALAEALKGDEPVMIICGDNYFSESLGEFIKAFDGNLLVGVYDVKDRELVKQYGVVEAYPSGRIKRIFEKPEKPSGTLVSTGLYIFPSMLFAAIGYFTKVSSDKNLGELVNFFAQCHPVQAYPIGGIWLDIGDHESYQKALRIVT